MAEQWASANNDRCASQREDSGIGAQAEWSIAKPGYIGSVGSDSHAKTNPNTDHDPLWWHVTWAAQNNKDSKEKMGIVDG